MKKLLTVALLTLSGLASAAPPEAWQKNPWPDPSELKEKAERRMRLLQVLELAETLQLSEPEALRLAEKIRSFDAKRKPLREQMAEAMKTVRAAADGDSAALSQVDAAVDRILDSRARLAAIDQEMFKAVSRDLSPQKKAQLAVFFARMHEDRVLMKGAFKPRMKMKHVGD